MRSMTLEAANVNPVPAENPRDSWPDWTDEFTWELGPEVEPPADPEDFAAVLLPVVSVEVLDLVRDGYRLRRELALAIPVPTQDTRDHSAVYDPSEYQDAYHVGYSLFVAGEDADAPRPFTWLQLCGFYEGYQQAREDAEDRERLAFGEPERHDDERVRALGCVEARRG